MLLTGADDEVVVGADDVDLLVVEDVAVLLVVFDGEDDDEVPPVEPVLLVDPDLSTAVGSPGLAGGTYPVSTIVGSPPLVMPTIGMPVTRRPR